MICDDAIFFIKGSAHICVKLLLSACLSIYHYSQAVTTSSAASRPQQGYSWLQYCSRAGVDNESRNRQRGASSRGEVEHTGNDEVLDC